MEAEPTGVSKIAAGEALSEVKGCELADLFGVWLRGLDVHGTWPEGSQKGSWEKIQAEGGHCQSMNWPTGMKEAKSLAMLHPRMKRSS